jgi:hypothetical protein
MNCENVGAVCATNPRHKRPRFCPGLTTSMRGIGKIFACALMRPKRSEGADLRQRIRNDYGNSRFDIMGIPAMPYHGFMQNGLFAIMFNLRSRAARIHFL